MNAMRDWLVPRVAFAATNERVTLSVFTLTIFLSALLLFAVQPMFARMVLPKLGGSPSVWAVSMVFFQAMLLAGYAYAHVLNRYLGATSALLTHLTLLIVALITLPIALPSFGSQPPTGAQYFWLLGVLAVGVGLPFFAVSANAPLLQSWFARSGHSHANDPYFLYGASNVGSMLALLSYPFLVEPVFGLGEQSSLWAIGFGLLAVLISVCGGLMLVCSAGSQPTIEKVASTAGRTNATTAITWQQRSVWIALAFIPSALLVAFTSYISTDIASAPFLWVLPLAAFLGTFIVTFRDKPLIPHEFLLKWQVAVVGLAILCSASAILALYTIAIVASLLAFLFVTLICHRELYLRRPDASHLTEFYLLMSLGGVLGGIFAALIAPQIFTTIFEFPLLLAASLLIRPDTLAKPQDRREWMDALHLVAGVAAVLLSVKVLMMIGVIEGNMHIRTLVVIALLGAMLYNAKLPSRRMAFVSTMLLVIFFLPEGRNEAHAVRSFFGVHRVVDTNASLRLLMHGTTVHGVERLTGEQDKPTAGVYYHKDGAMRRALTMLREARGGGALDVGIVGVGAGSMACYKQPGDNWTFYEIDEAVVNIARDPKLFRYLSSCQPDAEIVLGDARLTLANRKNGTFDYLLIDAFSSDAIPAHLLTVEALQLYASKLAPDGLLALHLSNKYLDLAPAVAASLTKVGGLHAVFVRDRPKKASAFEASPSDVMLIGRSSALVEKALDWKGASPAEAKGVAFWTDDYSDIFGALLRRKFGAHH